ncbi:TPA: hypothetical protein ACH3X2_006323 [Trebouxia sp. C0005]
MLKCQRRTRMADQSMGCRGAILSVTVKFISIMAMLYFSTLLTDSPENQVAGAAGDLRAMRAASSVCELIHLACLVLALVAIAVVLHRKLGPSVRTLMHSSGHQPARRRAARRTCRRDARDAALFILGIASMSVILTGSATPPLHLTHPLLSSKWGPGVHSSATASPDFAHQGSHQPLSALGRVQSSPPLRDKVTPLPKEQLATPQLPVAQNSVSGNNILLIWMLSNQEQSLQPWQPGGMSASAAAPAAVACTSHTLTVVPQQAMQRAMAKPGESCTALAVVSDKAPISTATASLLQGPTFVKATVSTADGMSRPTVAKPSGQSSADILTQWVFWANEQSMQQWQPELFTHAAVVPATQAVAKPDASAAVAAAIQSHSPFAELTTEAAVAKSASAVEQGRSTAEPSAPVLSTAQAASPENVPEELKSLGSVPAILQPVKLITEEAYPALVQLFMGSILGQVLLGVFMLALGGIILPGLCLWWEFGTISPAVGALIAPIEDPPDPMTLKIKNAGVDASKSLSRNSSLIKARVTRDLPGLPSLQPLHHVLSGAESVLARIMRLSSKVDTIIPEKGGEAAPHSGAPSAAASATHSGGEAAAAANAQARHDAPQQQAKQGTIDPQAQHLEGSQPAVPVEERQTAVPVEERQPAVPVEERQPAVPVEEKQPAVPVEERQPAVPVDERQTAVPVEERQTAVPVEERQPAVPVEARQPAVPVEERQTAVPVEERQPAVPVEARQPAVPVEARQPAVPVEARQPAVPLEGCQPAVLVPQQAQPVPYCGPAQLPAFVPAPAVPAPFVQHMPVMAPAPVPVISASVTNMQVVAGPELAANSGVQQASPKVQKRVTKKTKALGVLRKLVCLPPS